MLHSFSTLGKGEEAVQHHSDMRCCYFEFHSNGMAVATFNYPPVFGMSTFSFGTI